jgi:hypothetical protein
LITHFPPLFIFILLYFQIFFLPLFVYLTFFLSFTPINSFFLISFSLSLFLSYLLSYFPTIISLAFSPSSFLIPFSFFHTFFLSFSFSLLLTYFPSHYFSHLLSFLLSRQRSMTETRPLNTPHRGSEATSLLRESFAVVTQTFSNMFDGVSSTSSKDPPMSLQGYPYSEGGGEMELYDNEAPSPSDYYAFQSPKDKDAISRASAVSNPLHPAPSSSSGGAGSAVKKQNAWRDKYVMKFSGWKSSEPDEGEFNISCFL